MGYFVHCITIENGINLAIHRFAVVLWAFRGSRRSCDGQRDTCRFEIGQVNKHPALPAFQFRRGEKDPFPHWGLGNSRHLRSAGDPPHNGVERSWPAARVDKSIPADRDKHGSRGQGHIWRRGSGDRFWRIAREGHHAGWYICRRERGRWRRLQSRHGSHGWDRATSQQDQQEQG